MGSGTASPQVAGGTTYYLPLASIPVLFCQRSTLGANVLVKSGRLAVQFIAGIRTCIDRVNISANVTLQPSFGWKQVVRVFNLDPRQHTGYESNMLKIYATLGTTWNLAAPFRYPGQASVATTPFGLIPSLEA